jgi:hypothetical protein
LADQAAAEVDLRHRKAARAVEARVFALVRSRTLGYASTFD